MGLKLGYKWFVNVLLGSHDALEGIPKLDPISDTSKLNLSSSSEKDKTEMGEETEPLEETTEQQSKENVSKDETNSSGMDVDMDTSDWVYENNKLK